MSFVLFDYYYYLFIGGRFIPYNSREREKKSCTIVVVVATKLINIIRNRMYHGSRYNQSRANNDGRRRSTLNPKNPKLQYKKRV